MTPMATGDPQAIAAFLQILRTEVFPDPTWEYAMNELSNPVSEAFSRAFDLLRAAAGEVPPADVSAGDAERMP